jgi:hypothetical protein
MDKGKRRGFPDLITQWLPSKRIKQILDEAKFAFSSSLGKSDKMTKNSGLNAYLTSLEAR